jgi:hypothetical protein
MGKKSVKKSPHPALCDLDEGLVLVWRKTRIWVPESAAIWFVSTAYRRFFTPGIFTIRLKPQMKKYRSLWYMSTANHNILYFLHIYSI